MPHVQRLVVALRKLFLTHAGELAHRLVSEVGRGGLVARFVRSYIEQHDRHGLLSDPARLPELESTIGREALLVMAANVKRLLPEAFKPGPKGTLRADDAAFVNVFYADFLAALSRAMAGSPKEAENEAETFSRDLGMYRRWDERLAVISRDRHANESPFRDRCAILLDPDMMEEARGAAADFEKEVLHTASQRFAHLGQSRLSVGRPKQPRAPKSKRPKTKKSSRPRAAKSTRRKPRTPGKPPRR